MRGFGTNLKLTVLAGLLAFAPVALLLAWPTPVWGDAESGPSTNPAASDYGTIAKWAGLACLVGALAIGTWIHRILYTKSKRHDELRPIHLETELAANITRLESQKRSLVAAMAELQVSKDRVHAQNLRLKELASKDSLTGCFNRLMLIEQLEAQWINFLKTGTTVNIIILDVDHFKDINDTHGHMVGDKVLATVGRILRESAGDVGFVGRYGGDEFCIILSGLSVEESVQVAEGARRMIQYELADPDHITASIGISNSNLGANSCQSLLEQADLALYAAKRAGRNHVQMYSCDISGCERETSIAQSVHNAVGVARNSLSYQAITALHSALAYRDAETALHCQRVSDYCVALGRGLMSISELYLLEAAGLLHDIGKIGVPDSVLHKTESLTNEEYKIMRAHTSIGVEIIHSCFHCDELSDMVRYHHHFYDGSDSAKDRPLGKDIPLGARIIAVVDAYDALVSDRVYRKGCSPELAFAELRRFAGTQFDPELVERFISLKVGWRPDSRYFVGDVEDAMAISVGHLTAQTIAAFESKYVKSLAESLDQLKQVARMSEQPGIVHVSNELSKAIAGRTIDWDAIVPILQNLVDLCLIIQRAHIREIACRPQVTPNCPQEAYFRMARSWEAEDAEEIEEIEEALSAER